MKRSAIMLLSLLICTEVHANRKEAEILVKGCAEFAAILDRHGEMALLAGLTTSTAEAMRAGYCKGVIEQYRRQHSQSCSRQDWRAQAQSIADSDVSDRTSISELLSESCG